uniref:RNA-binding protein FUS-like n=1 Tax=Elaeis guineensis var. tenera TaxID=51953 RepID=A0A6I9QG60_ELAGV|nr:RNA-binding protein FUS-like [Elaeis guineensis]
MAPSLSPSLSLILTGQGTLGRGSDGATEEEGGGSLSPAMHCSGGAAGEEEGRRGKKGGGGGTVDPTMGRVDPKRHGGAQRQENKGGGREEGGRLGWWDGGSERLSRRRGSLRMRARDHVIQCGDIGSNVALTMQGLVGGVWRLRRWGGGKWGSEAGEKREGGGR